MESGRVGAQGCDREKDQIGPGTGGDGRRTAKRSDRSGASVAMIARNGVAGRTGRLIGRVARVSRQNRLRSGSGAIAVAQRMGHSDGQEGEDAQHRHQTTKASPQRCEAGSALV